MKDLLVITTAGQIKWLKNAIQSLRDDLDVLVVDDATPEEVGIKKFCKEKGIVFVTKGKPQGVVDSLNKGYEFFREHGYKRCIQSNDDVLFPKGFSKGLLGGLEKFDLVGPLSNQPGTGHHQRIEKFINIKPTVEDIDQVQKAISKKYTRDPFLPCSSVNGFCLAFSYAIERFAYSDKCLFPSERKNVGNEYRLQRRMREMGGRVAICRASYVYHVKGGTFKKFLPGKDRERIWR